MDLVAKTLEQFGLSENEVKVYRKALTHEVTSPFELSRETGIARTTVYEAITSLSLKGLVELVRSDGMMKQQTKIRAKNPSVLRELISKKQDDLSRLDVDVVGILPELKGQFLAHTSNADFKFYAGIEGASAVYEQLSMAADAQEEIVAWDCLMPMDAFGRERMNKWVDTANERLARGRRNIRSLIPLTKWTKHVMTYQFERDKRYVMEQYRYIEDSRFEMYQDIHVQGNRVSIVSGVQEEAWGLVINSPFLAKSLKSMFEIQWSIATPLTVEILKSWGPNKFLEKEKERKRKEI